MAKDERRKQTSGFRVGSIYVITNLVNGKKYVGQTVQKVNKRWRSHIKAAIKLEQSEPLCRAIRKYGECKFSIEVVHQCTEPLLDAAERFFIRHLNTIIDAKQGYNLQYGGRANVRPSKVSCRKLSLLGTKLWATPDHREKMSRVRKTTLEDLELRKTYVARLHTPEAQRRSANSRTGRKQSAAHRAAIAAGQARRWAKPEEHKKASEKARQAWLKPEVVAKRAAARCRPEVIAGWFERAHARPRTAAGKFL